MFSFRHMIVSLIMIAAITVSPASADEGMWPLYDLDKLPFDKMQHMGLELSPLDIYNPDGVALADAVVNVGSSSSFVSAKGLIITNHHVAAGAVQRQSTVEHNYLRDGFYAPTIADEIPALGYNCYVTLSVEDVTDRILAGVTDEMSDRERYDVIDAASKKIVKECEAGRDVYCDIADMFGGKQYMLYTYFRIKDVRIVYAPPEAIGNYGDDIDNWMWPRHVGDFTFLRAYVAPDGSSAEFSKDNVPYHPKKFFTISSQGVKEGDFTILLGYPGRTNRYASSFEIDHLLNYSYPRTIAQDEEILDIYESFMKTDSTLAIRLESSYSGLHNYYKKTLGLYAGFKKSSLLAKKQATEKQLTAFLNENPDLKHKYGHVLGEMDSIYQVSKQTELRDDLLGSINRRCEFLGMANSVYRWAVEREKDDLDRENGYQERDFARAKQRMKTRQINLVPEVDKRMMRYVIEKALALPAGQQIAVIQERFGRLAATDGGSALEAIIEKMYANTQIGDLDARMKMLEMSREELENLNDAFINLAKALQPDMDDRRERSKAESGALSRLDPLLVQAYAEWKHGNLYPDANGTKRFNYGTVKGYSPADAVTYRYITTLTGVMEKETGVDPFIVPEELKAVYKKKDFGSYVDPIIHDVPVDFLTTNSGTNGNSGSPVLNGKGELIGLDFDTGFEGVAADYLYDADICRAIVSDIRYTLFIIDKVYHLENLLNELTIH